MQPSPPGPSHGSAEERAARFQRSVGVMVALAAFLGSLGAFGLGLALWNSRDLARLARERDALREEVARLAVSVASRELEVGEVEPDDELRERLRESGRETRESEQDLAGKIDALAAEFELLGQDLDELLGRELVVTTVEGLASPGRDQLLPLGMHVACFLVYTNPGTSQNSACDLQHDAFSGAWSLFARRAECRAACLDWR
jgi:hypothetical protein